MFSSGRFAGRPRDEMTCATCAAQFVTESVLLCVQCLQVEDSLGDLTIVSPWPLDAATDDANASKCDLQQFCATLDLSCSVCAFFAGGRRAGGRREQAGSGSGSAIPLVTAKLWAVLDVLRHGLSDLRLPRHRLPHRRT